MALAGNQTGAAAGCGDGKSGGGSNVEVVEDVEDISLGDG